MLSLTCQKSLSRPFETVSGANGMSQVSRNYGSRAYV